MEFTPEERIEAESRRMAMCELINSNPQTLERIREVFPDAMTTAEMTNQFTVNGFMAPFTVVTRDADGVRGTLMFQHNPRVYFNFRGAV